MKKKKYPGGMKRGMATQLYPNGRKFGMGVASAITGKQTPNYEPPVRQYAAGGIMSALGGMGGGATAGGTASMAGGGPSLMGGLTKGFNLIGDTAGLFAATQGDEKAAKIAATSKNIGATTNIMDQEMKKDKQGIANLVKAKATGDPNAAVEGINQIKDNGTEITPGSVTPSMDSEEFYSKYGYRPGEMIAKYGMRVTKKRKKK